MIERCFNCEKEHDTGDMKPIHGVPVVRCPKHSYGGFQYPPGYERQLYRLGYIKGIVFPMLQADRHVEDYRWNEVKKFPPLRAVGYAITR